ncbi:MAG: MFS transporter [Methylocystaceae bacterium]
MRNFLTRYTSQVIYFVIATVLMGVYSGMYEPSFNNYLAQVHNLDAVARGALELPRELPGFLVVFVFAVLAFMADTRIAAISALLVGISLWGQGFLAPNFFLVIIWMVVWSTGGHLFMALTPGIGLRMAPEGQEGRWLGRLSALESVGSLVGLALVYLLTRVFDLGFTAIFAAAGCCAAIAALCLLRINAQTVNRPRRLIYRRQYNLYYLLNIIFGARKQVFLTFAPWVLITMFSCSVADFALLIFIATVLGLVFRPWLGKAIDNWGERTVIAGESFLLIGICLLYGFSPGLLPYQSARLLVMACFISDQVLFAVRIARTTFLNRIALDASEIPSTISMGLTLDHAVSMSIPLLGGLLWKAYGFQWVFVVAALLAVINLGVALLIPRHSPAISTTNPG